MAFRVSISLALVAAAALSACSDPVHTHQVDALGGEKSGVPKGPLHRPGQPCVTCHGEYGPANSEFSFGGTVYQDLVNTIPLPDAKVTLVDSNGKTYETGTNCAGNFFVLKTDYNPLFPVWTTVFFGTMEGKPIPKDMSSPIFREGSCAACHGDPAGTDAAGHVYLSEDPFMPPLPPSPSCP
jgi:mono/diheme cytochrome c family protein